MQLWKWQRGKGGKRGDDEALLTEKRKKNAFKKCDVCFQEADVNVTAAEVLRTLHKY